MPKVLLSCQDKGGCASFERVLPCLIVLSTVTKLLLCFCVFIACAPESSSSVEVSQGCSVHAQRHTNTYAHTRTHARTHTHLAFLFDPACCRKTCGDGLAERLGKGLSIKVVLVVVAGNCPCSPASVPMLLASPALPARRLLFGTDTVDAA